MVFRFFIEGRAVNVHFTRFLGSGHANLLSKYRTHPTENIWKETSVEGKHREANDGAIQDSKLGGERQLWIENDPRSIYFYSTLYIL
jgi:hypothetical protein